MEPDEIGVQAERIAAAFHGAYEVLAPEHGYETREASAKPWEEVPQQNRDLMIATVRTLIENGVIVPGPEYASDGALGMTRDELRGTAR